jgi:hypothetical protein
MAPSGPPPADAADARTYEPRAASERALRGLATWLEGRGDTAVIAGAPGAGTTYVLHRFEAQERARRAVLFSPFLHIEAVALEGWLDGLARAAGFGSLDAWLAPAPRAPLLLVDEADTAAPAALEALARLRAARAPQLRVCLGGCSGAALERAAQLVATTGLLVLELPPWSEDDLRRLAASLCAVGAADAAALVAAADGSPGLLRLTWGEQRDRRPRPAPPPAEPRPPPAPLQLPARAAVRAAVTQSPEPPAALPPSEPAATTSAPAPAVPRPSAPESNAPAAPRSRRRSRMPWFHAAALVIGFALGLAGGWGWDAREPAPEVVAPAAVAPSLPEVSARPRVVAAAAPSRHDVQVNARPWAWIRIDGEAVGVTPLVQRGLAAGPHEFEATFPDGTQQRRSVEIGADSRFVSFSD